MVEIQTLGMVSGPSSLMFVPLWHELSEDVRDDRVGQRRNLVLEHQLALLEAGDFDLVDRTRRPQCFDFFIEPTMLAFKKDQYLSRIVIVHGRCLDEAADGVTRLPVAGGTAVRRCAAASGVIGTRQEKRFVIYSRLSRLFHRKEPRRWIRDTSHRSRTSTLRSKR